MMGSNRINDFFGFMVFFSQFHTDFHMGTFNFMIKRLADVMQETCPTGHIGIHAEFGRHDAG